MTARRFAGLVLLASLLLQGAWIAVLPPYRGIDEIDHAYRAAAVAHGEWIAGPQAENGRGRLVTVPASLAAAAQSQCEGLPYTGPDNCTPVERLPDGMVRIASSAGGYPPVFYGIVGLAGKPFEGATALYAMRIGVALICSLFIASGAWCLAKARFGIWPRIGLLLALTPVAIYSSCVVAPNGPEIAAGGALWCALLSLPRSRSTSAERAVIIVAGVSGVLLVGLRGMGPAFFLITSSLCVLLNWVDYRRLWTKYRRLLIPLLVLIAMSAFAQLWWNLFMVGPSADVGWQAPRPESGASGSRPSLLVWSIQSAILWPFQTVAAFPFRGNPAPAFVYVTYFIGLIGLLAAAFVLASPRHRRALACLVLGVTLMPFAFTALTYSSAGGAIWQGRYGLPLAMGVSLVAGVGLDEGRRRSVRLPGWVVGLWFATTQVGGLVKVLHSELSRKESYGDPAWHPPSSLLVVMLVSLAAAAVAAGLSRRSSGPRSADTSPELLNSLRGVED